MTQPTRDDDGRSRSGSAIVANGGIECRWEAEKLNSVTLKSSFHPLTASSQWTADWTSNQAKRNKMNNKNEYLDLAVIKQSWDGGGQRSSKKSSFHLQSQQLQFDLWHSATSDLWPPHWFTPPTTTTREGDKNISILILILKVGWKADLRETNGTIVVEAQLDPHRENEAPQTNTVRTALSEMSSSPQTIMAHKMWRNYTFLGVRWMSVGGREWEEGGGGAYGFCQRFPSRL